jgi:hypothetical protein
MEAVVQRLGLTDLSPQEWLNLTPRDELPKPETEAFPRPPKRPGADLQFQNIISRPEKYEYFSNFI